MNTPTDLPNKWRETAENARHRLADDRGARILHIVADELEAAFATQRETVLSVAAAAEESGFSAAHLSRLVASGSIPNAGRKHSPGIRRRDLPQKPRAQQIAGRTASQIARSIAGA